MVGLSYIKYVLFVVLGLLLFAAVAYSQSPAIIELNADGSWNWVQTLTPVVVTAVPGSTQTPWIITATPPDIDASPTPETTPIPPTITVTPVPKECALRAKGTNIRIRSSASTSGTITGVWLSGTESVFVEFSEDTTYLWGKHKTGGWSVVAQKSPFAWWVDGTLSSELCFEVKGWPGWVPPEPIASNVALLWHTVPGFNIDNARASHTILQGKGIPFGYKNFASIDSCIETLEQGGICIWRHGNPDCPQNIGSTNPQASALDFISHYGQSAKLLSRYPNAYYEPVNECWYGDETHIEILAWWAEWMDTYITEARVQGFPKLVLPTLGPGYGSVVMYTVWKDVLLRNKENGGLMGEHAYTPYHADGLCSCDEWLACRHRTNEKYRQSVGLNIQVAITEAARGWGNDPVSVADFVCWYELIRHDAFLHSVALWTAGYHPSWPNANLDNYMVNIVQGVGLDTVRNLWDNSINIITSKYY